ncbi:MAG: ribose-phosphate diphosphokinase [Thermoplasmatota archaeon]
MRILPGSSNRALSENLSTMLDARLVQVQIERFPDGELYCRLLEDIDGEDVILVQSTYPDSSIVEFLILAQLARDSGAETVTGVIPYYGYSRQDRVFKEGESFTARTMALHLQRNLDNVICVNLHKESVLSEFSDVENAIHVSVMGVVGEFLGNAGIDYVLSPDKGAIGYAREAAGVLGCRFEHLEKTRLNGSTVTVAPKDLPVRGRKVCIVDDIIATGGTILKAQESLRIQGALEVYACCAHGLFTGGGQDRLEPVLDGLYCSDTIEGPCSSFSAARPVAEAVEKLFGVDE